MARKYLNDPVTRYALAVRAGEIVAGPHVRNACERHLRDYQTAKRRGLRFNVQAVERVLRFFEVVLRLSGGEHEDKPFVPEPWQAFVLGSLFGWQRKDDDGRWTRRFRVAFIETGKGSGKSPLAAGIGHYMMLADGEDRAEVYAAAVDKEQASVLFRDAVAMAKLSEAIRERVKFSGGEGREFNIAFPAKGSFFRPISSESSGRGKSGYRPHCVLLDEIHEHPTNAMVEFMRAGTKGRRQALIFMITNSGVDRTSVCYEYHDLATRVAAGEFDDDSFFGYVCALDEGEDPFKDRTCWPKANPSIGVTFRQSYLEEQVTQARGMPGKESLVRRLNFCEWTDAESPWIDGDLWRRCEVEGEDPLAFLEELRERRCVLALDLSSTRDLTSLAAVWLPEEAEDEDEDEASGELVAMCWNWTPDETLIERERRDQAPYGVWVRKGHLIAIPGRIIDYRYPAGQVAELVESHNVVGLAFDPWRIDDFRAALSEHAGLDSWLGERIELEDGSEKWVEKDSKYPGEGLMMVRHGQGTGGGTNKLRTLWMPDSVNALEAAVMQRNLRVFKNPVLTWASASAVLHADPANNRKWEKRKSTGRIDPVVALSMAHGLAKVARSVGTSSSPYSDRELLVI